MRTVIFDLDGTLADTSQDLLAAANACFAEMGHGPQLTLAEDKGVAFRGGRAMLTLGFSRLGTVDTALVDAQYPRLLEHYAKAIDTHTRLYPGALDAIERLRRQDIRVGICTNKPVDLAETLMARLGVRDRFDSLVGAGSLPVRKPDPAPYVLSVEQAAGSLNRSVLIGDTDTDRKTAAAAGVPCVLVTFGPDGDGVVDLKPEALLGHFSEFDEVVLPLLD